MWRDTGPYGYRHYYHEMGDGEVLRGPSVTTVCGWACDTWPVDMWRRSRFESRGMAGDPDQFTWFRAQQGTLGHWRCFKWLGDVFGAAQTGVKWGGEEMEAHEALCNPDENAPGSQNVLDSLYYERGHLSNDSGDLEDWEGNPMFMRTYTGGVYHPHRIWHEAMQTVEHEIFPMFRRAVGELYLKTVRRMEQKVFSTFDKYGGQYDFLAECGDEDGDWTLMADLKTGKAGFKSQFMQLAAYARASKHDPDRLAIVRCDPRADGAEIHYLRESRFTRRGLLDEFEDALYEIRKRYYD